MKPAPEGWPRISSALYYQDARAAIAWLCQAFGFEVHLLIDGPNGTVAHSELTYGGGLIMVSEASARSRFPYRRSPREVDGVNTQNMMVFVDDADAHCERARAAGAAIVSEPTVSDHGPDYWADKTYECADLEGHHWWFCQRLRTGGAQ
jgi:uncharacterized glyoxalase superfamily protein PhnB